MSERTELTRKQGARAHAHFNRFGDPETAADVRWTCANGHSHIGKPAAAKCGGERPSSLAPYLLEHIEAERPAPRLLTVIAGPPGVRIGSVEVSQ